MAREHNGPGRDSGEGRVSLDVVSDDDSEIVGSGRADVDIDDTPPEDREDPESPEEGDEGSDDGSEDGDADAPDEEEEEGDLEDEEDSEEDSEERDEGEDDLSGLSDEEEAAAAASGDSVIELGNGRKIDLSKVKGLAPEDQKELKRGFLREADYTRKLQDHAKVVQEHQHFQQGAAQIWDNYNVIQKDPGLLLNWFHPQQLLMACAVAGLEVDPALLPPGFNPKMGGGAAAGAGGGRQPNDPVVQRLTKLEEERSSEKFETDKRRYTDQITTALNEGLGKVKNEAVKRLVKRNALNIMAQQGEGFDPAVAVKQAKKEARDMLTGLRSDKMGKRRSVKVGKGGSSRALVGDRRKPKTWDQADASASNTIRNLSRGG